MTFEHVHLRQSIMDVFSRNTYPGDSQLVSHRCLECDEIATAFKGTHWRDWIAPNKKIEEYTEALSLFTLEAYRFFLPAFMITCVDRFKETSSKGIPERLFFSLTRSDLTPSWTQIKDVPGVPSDQMEQIRAAAKEAAEDPEVAQFFERRMERLSDEELLCVRTFLEAMKVAHAEWEVLGEIGRALLSITEYYAKRRGQR